MFKSAILGLLLLAIGTHAFSQTGFKVTGTLKDSVNHVDLKNASILLINPADSIIINFTRAKAGGTFLFDNVAPGKYNLLVTQPYFGDYLDKIDLTNNKNLGNIYLTSKAKLLQSVIVTSGSPIRIKGDTTVYTADSFKVAANASAADLLKKMPGITVDKNGQIMAMGEAVNQVLVDGEEFFGDDPGLTIKTIRADAIKEVQVFDKKSEQATFTGIDDGKTQKTINLKLKEDKKKGYFGKIDGALGTNKTFGTLYKLNAMYNRFVGKEKISAYFLNNTFGQDGLSWDEREKYDNGSDENTTMTVDEENGSVMYQTRSSEDEPYINPANGFTNSLNVGAQYANKWEKTTFSIAPKYNRMINDNKETVQSTTTAGNVVLTSSSNTSTHTNRSNEKIRTSFEHKFDSSRSIKIVGGVNLYTSDITVNSQQQTTNDKNVLLNASTRENTVSTDKHLYYATATYKQKFKKERRTLTIDADLKMRGNDGDNYTKSDNFINGQTQHTLQNQVRNFEKTNNNLVLGAVYTEPLNKNWAMQFGYKYHIVNGDNNENTYTYTPATGKYDTKVDSLSNNFDQNIAEHIPSIKFSYAKKKLKFSFGSGVSVSKFDFKNISTNTLYKRKYSNFSPTLSFKYTSKKGKNYGFGYNGSMSQPSISELQPLNNNADLLNQYIGNPNLKPTFNNSITANFQSYNFLKNTWKYIGIYFDKPLNDISTSRTTDLNTGVTKNQSINVNGNYSLVVWAGTGTKLKKVLKDVSVFTNINISTNQYVQYINTVESPSKGFNGSWTIQLNKDKEKKYEVGLGNTLGRSINTLAQQKNKQKYWSNEFQCNAKIYIHKTFNIGTDYSYEHQQAIENLAAFNLHLWNARIEKTFAKDQFTVYTGVRDILNQNRGISRNFSNNTFMEVQNQKMGRIFLIGLRWDFKNNTKKTNSK